MSRRRDPEMKDRLRALGWEAGKSLLRARRDEMADRVNRQLARQSEALTRQAAILLDRASGLSDRLDSIQADVTRRLVPQPKPRRGRMMLLLIVGAGAGY